MLKTHVYALLFISFTFCTQKIHGIMHHIYVPSFLSCHLNSTRGYKHLYFYHLPSNQLAHNKYMMITHVYVLFSFGWLIICILISPVVIVSTQKYMRWHGASYICAFLYTFWDLSCFVFIKHTINIV